MWGMLSFPSGARQSSCHRWMRLHSRLALPLLLEGENSCSCNWADCPLKDIHRPFLASCSCLMTSSLSAASVAVVTRNEPSRVKVVLLASKVAVTPHSFSRFCFRSRQAANAQPTAWLSLSPCQANKTVYTLQI